MIIFHQKIILSHYFSWGFCGTNQLVSIFILYLMITENVTCFFLKIWCSKYHNMQYWLSSNHVLIIIPSYDVHHVHESQSNGMDHQWSQITMLIDIIKMTFLYIITRNIYYYHLSPWYILWCGYATNLIIRKKPDFLLY